MARRSDIDWEAIQADYLTGQLSDVQLAKKHGVSRSTLQGKIKAGNWRRDLSKTVEQATKAALIEQARNQAEEIGQRIGQQSGTQAISSVEAAVQARVAILNRHQVAALDSHNLAVKLIREVAEQTTGALDLKEMARLVEAADMASLADALRKAASLPTRVASLKGAVEALAKAQDLERRANMIKDDEGAKGSTAVEDLFESLDRQLKEEGK